MVNIFDPTPFNLSMLGGILLLIILVVIDYYKNRKIEFHELILIVITAFFTSAAITYTILGPIYYGFTGQMYSVIDQDAFRRLIAMGGIITVMGSFYLIYTRITITRSKK